MTITLQLPEHIAAQLAADGQDLSRAALELMVLEAYRERKLSTEQVRQALGFATRYELDGFFKQHDVWLEYSLQDLDREGESSRQLLAKRKQDGAIDGTIDDHAR